MSLAISLIDCLNDVALCVECIVDLVMLVVCVHYDVLLVMEVFICVELRAITAGRIRNGL